MSSISKEQLNETLVQLNKNQQELERLAKKIRDNILSNNARKSQVIDLLKTLETSNDDSQETKENDTSAENKS